MTDRTSLGDRMKRYEQATSQTLPPRSYAVVRVDMRAAHTFLRGATRPFDADFVANMNSVAAALCKEIQGAQFAYTQSDEVSVLYTDFQSIESQPWFGGVVAKQISIAASLASSVTTEHCHGERPPTFDARVFTLPDAVEVANYFVWRQRDAVRNSIHMVARAHMSHKECLGKNTDQLQEELFQRFAVNWNDYDDGLKRGRVTENWGDGWKTFAAPHFKAESGNWLADSIPAKASFDG